jgi:hypothetical protein
MGSLKVHNQTILENSREGCRHWEFMPSGTNLHVSLQADVTRDLIRESWNGGSRSLILRRQVRIVHASITKLDLGYPNSASNVKQSLTIKLAGRLISTEIFVFPIL